MGKNISFYFVSFFKHNLCRALTLVGKMLPNHRTSYGYIDGLRSLNDIYVNDIIVITILLM